MSDKREERPKENSLPVLTDADIVMYRSAWSANKETEEVALDKVDEVIGYIYNGTGGEFPDKDLHKFYLSGKGNFRYDIAVTAPYKGNRKGLESPQHKDAIREYLISQYSAIESAGEESDDLIAITSASMGYDCIVATTDKDFNQLPCWLYNFSYNTWQKPTEFEATKNFYTQILTGDTVDNIKGLYGIGPVKAGKILEDSKSEKEMWEACLKAYDNDYDRVLENARLLWLRRREEEMWEPPA